MSIKIYDGLRIKIKDIEKFTKIFDKRCLDFLEQQTSGLMKAVKKEKLLKSAEKAIGIRNNMSAEDILKVPAANDYFRFLEVARLYLISMKEHANFLNPECWFNAFPYNGYFYIVPEYPTNFKCPKYPKYVEDFSYWNNTDPPNNVSWEEFCKRAIFWKKCGALDTPFRNRLSHTLIDGDQKGQDLVLIEKRLIRNNSQINGRTPVPASYTAEYRLEGI
jgi:hypothetical protein